MRKLKKIQWQKPMVVTLVLMVCMIAGSVITTGWLNYRAEQSSFRRLYEETERLAQNIELFAQNDREELELLAAVISRYPDLTSQSLWDILDSYSAVGMMSRLELLLPDDTVLTRGGVRLDAGGQLSFAQQAELGSHITDPETDLTSGEAILRHYVPVVRDGETVAMLYGIVKLGTLPEKVWNNPYSGKAAIYIIEGKTGDFLVDTWHNQPGNIWSLGERPMAPGYDHEQLKQGLIDGETGYVVFVSQTTGEYLYFYYQPMEINAWRIALSVPEDTVFASANAIRIVLNAFLLFEVLCFVLYFLWMLRYVRRETSEKQRRLDIIQSIYDVEKLLFNAHERQENVIQALEQTAHMLSAQQVRFWMPDQIEGGTCFTWLQNEQTQPQMKDLSTGQDAHIFAIFREGTPSVEAHDEKTLQAVLPAGEAGMVKSFMAVPVEEMDGSVCGVLSACNVPNSAAKLGLLKSVALSFGMFCHNRTMYHAMKEQGEKDVLTGLYNRNRYERDLPEYLHRYQTSLACVYLDVNGLHEMNNSKGHAAGDEILKAVAQQLRDKFGNQGTYRIGGDEFLVLCMDMEEETVQGRTAEIEEALAQAQFHVSAGCQWQRKVSSMEELVKAAEKKMYTAKQAYYQTKRTQTPEQWR